MTTVVRGVIVLSLVIAFVVARLAYARWRRGLAAEPRSVPRVPRELLGGTDRTWVIFTTPYCATCEPVREQLEASDASARVVTVDATLEPSLAESFHVRAAPTVFLADADGTVRQRLVGADAVRDYVAATA